MEGVLLVPPDRGPIIGKPVWKPRYVVVGPQHQKEGQPSNLSLSQVLSTARTRDVGVRSAKSQQKAPADILYFSVYKSKEDSEPIIQHSIASITDCQVQHIAHRKQGHLLPTLTMQISPDPATDKLRKRRSSRTTGLITNKDTGSTKLWFLATEESRYSLGDWARYIQSLVQQQQQFIPMSPTSPTSPAFISPFPPMQEPVEKPGPISNAKGKLRSKLQAKSSGRAHTSSRDQSSIYPSGSPSLRSRKSDLSSRASSMIPPSMTFVQQHYANLQHSDLPSPASTVDEHPERFIEGWTSSQGRSSALSSPIRTRGSISSSSHHDPSQPSLDSSPRIAPRETILDRAFQMRYIPGSDREVAGEEKLTSLARFEALMCEAEHRQKATGRKGSVAQEPLKSTWEDDESDDDEFGKEVEEEDEDSDNYAFEQHGGYDETDPSARALKFITSRHNSTYSEAGMSSILRPHTAHSRSRPATHRTSSQPHVHGPSLHMLPSSSRLPEGGPMRRSHEKRHSTSDVKNLSFNDFAKRLSGTSSLLLVQSNASTGSNRGSGDYDTHTPRGTQTPDERCRWRGSIGVFGNEGGFL